MMQQLIQELGLAMRFHEILETKYTRELEEDFGQRWLLAYRNLEIMPTHRNAMLCLGLVKFYGDGLRWFRRRGKPISNLDVRLFVANFEGSKRTADSTQHCAMI